MHLQYIGRKSGDEIERMARRYKFNAAVSSNSMIISGDNFKAMSCLLASGYEGKIDLCYIDPPFLTGQTFTFSEERTRTISSSKSDLIAYEDRFNKEEYFEFMRERFILIHKLLSEQGSFYLHIDVKIGHYLKILLDEIFGYENFINDITRKKSNPKNFQRRAYGNEKDVIYFYAKNKGQNIWNDIKTELSDEELDKSFGKIQDDGRRYTTVPVHAPGECAGVTGGKWRGILPPKGRHYRTAPCELDKMDELGLIEWSSNGNPRIKKYADCHEGKKTQDIWLDFKDPMYPCYPTQKNMEMLQFIVRQSSNENSLVLDAFAGSGTFLSAARHFNRRFIAIDKGDEAVRLLKDKLLYMDLFDQPQFIDIGKEIIEDVYMDAKEYSVG